MRIKLRILLIFLIVPLLALVFYAPHSKISLIAKCLAVNDPNVCRDCSPTGTGCMAGWPHGWFDCDPNVVCNPGGTPNPNAHCNVNPPGVNGMECENRCPNGWTAGPSTGNCPLCSNPTWLCYNAPLCSPAPYCHVDPFTNVQDGWQYDANNCGAPYPGCNQGACPSGVSACINGVQYGYNGACGRVPVAGCMSISGTVFNDINKDHQHQGGEPGVGSSGTVTIGGTTVAVDGSGNFAAGGLTPGNYWVTYNGPLPSGYKLVYPIPAQFNVNIGPGACSVSDSTTGGTCDANGNVVTLNFSISNSNPWIQTVDGDVRQDSGVNYIIPQTADVATCKGPYFSVSSNGTNPGNIISGNGTSNFGGPPAAVSTTGWNAGGGTYPEVFTNGPLSTSYANLLSRAQKAGLTLIPLTSLAGCGSLSSCHLPVSLAKGVYIATGDVNLYPDKNSFSPNNNYVFLINGNLTFMDQVLMKNNATALFSTSANIYVDTTVGATGPSCSGDAQLQGFFSADQDFQVNGNSNCVAGPDIPLITEGDIIVNAAGNGGGFRNKRDLCAADQNFPAVLMRPNLSLVLSAPTFLMKTTTVSQEVAP